MQNIHRVKDEPLLEGANINVITHSGMATGGRMDKAEAKLLIRKVAIKQDGLDLAKEKEAFVTARQEVDSTKVPTHTTKNEEVGVFLQACMKLLRN